MHQCKGVCVHQRASVSWRGCALVCERELGGLCTSASDVGVSGAGARARARGARGVH